MRNLFNQGNLLKKVIVKIDDNIVVKESLLSIEMTYRNDTPKLSCKIIIDDLPDWNLQVIWRDVIIYIEYMDLFDNIVKKEFKITNIQELYDNDWNKSLQLELQDLFSFTLQHSFISKSYTDNPVSALEEYIKELKIDNFEWAKLELTPIKDTYSFVIPRNINNLDWFLYELRKHGYSFYQTKKNIIVKSFDELKPKNLPEEPNAVIGQEFTNETSNQLFQNKIHDLRISFNKKIIQKNMTSWYNPETKTYDTNSENDNSDYFLNDDKFNLQDSYDELTYQEYISSHNFFNETHKQFLKESYENQSNVEIIINGYEKNDINQQYLLKLKGNIGSIDSQNYGNIINNGKYISYKLSEKIISEHMIQRVFLRRADMIKKPN